ncbi:hypothetical protein QBC47DRAFT_384468 [Echria macrotheca]|uniref:Dystroglycan-type cadherin-like domain-containing protein n=1 Tax=Echria macrotheca TaxID=438768 RepID=A0AAJ0BAD2_9PEZI|nr:hypothetical protein QBC47DRAFT_384468 [Echria macrotheca]
MASRVVWIFVALLSGTTVAVPAISFPINSQVPPVARIGQPFSFVFSPSTFTSTSAITYTLANPPRWLSVDSAARRLWGTPSDAEIGPGQVVGVPVSLVATDATGATTMDATLVVSRSPGPKLNVPFDKQPPQFGTFSAPSTVLSAPQTQFSFNLAGDTFLDPSGSALNYYALMTDNSPLPAWISFDAAKLSFSGRTPPSESLISPPQRFSFQVVASDVVGFAAASLQFDIVVGTDIAPVKHQITADRTTISLNAIAGTAISYTGLRELVKLDGTPAAPDLSIASVTDAPPWISVDKNAWGIHGIPPDSAKSTSFGIVIQDKSSDTLNLTITIEITPVVPKSTELFKATIPEVNATAGENFSFDLSQYLTNPKDTEVSVAAGAASWVRFEPGTTKISGTAPQDSGDTAVRIPIQAKSKTTGKSETASLSIRIQKSANLPQGSDPRVQYPSPTEGSTTSSTEGSLASPGDEYVDPTPNLLLLAIVLPTSIIIASVTCLLFWCYRRRKERRRPKLTTRDISGPIPGTFVMNVTGPFNRGRYSTQDFITPQHESRIDHIASEEKGFIESRTTYMTNSSVPRQSATIRLLPPIEGSPSADDVFTSGGATALLTAAAPLPKRPSRYGLRNERSLSSISETSVYEESRPQTRAAASNSTAFQLLGTHSLAGTPFRDAVEVHIPTLARGITRVSPTPGSAYTEPVSSLRESAHTSPVSPISGASASSSDSDARPLRAESRLGHYPLMASTRKFAWPWFKRKATFKSNTTRPHSRKPSIATVDTFAYKKTPDARYDRTPVSPPRPARLPTQATPSVRPVTRRGTVTTRSSPISFSNSHPPPDVPLPSSPTMGYAAQQSAAQQNRLRQPSLADSLGIRTPVQGDYSDLVGKGPFHASRTWSSLNGGDEWADETVQSRSIASMSQPNWTTMASGALGTESPKVGGNLYLTGSKEFGSELGSELLSPDKWPTAEGHGKGQTGKPSTLGGGSSRERMSPIRIVEAEGANNGDGMGKQSRSQGLSIVSDGSPRFL